MNEAGVALVPLAEVVVVALAISAAQLVKFWPPRKTPTVWASVKWIVCNIPAARVAFVAQKSMVKLKVLAMSLHIGTTVVPS